MSHLVFRDVRRHWSSKLDRLFVCGRPFLVKSAHDRLSYFHSTARSRAMIPFLLADIGEGITECQIMKWSVKPGDRVEQFDSICEVQSDKASVEITSRFDGVIKALHYETDDMAVVGQPLLDIDVEDVLHEGSEKPSIQTKQKQVPGGLSVMGTLLEDEIQQTIGANDPQTLEEASEVLRLPIEGISTEFRPTPMRSSTSEVNIATPAVRHMLSRLKISMEDIQGTGKGGRVTKEDVQRYSASAVSPLLYTAPSLQIPTTEDQRVMLNPIENQMFKVMTRSLTIPHFLFTHQVDFTSLNEFRRTFESDRSLQALFQLSEDSWVKLTTLPFIMKALSHAFLQTPKLNSHLDIDSDSQKPQLILKRRHNFGVAINTPQGLLVPVVYDVQKKSVIEIANDLNHLSGLAKNGQLEPKHFRDATFIVSNIGSIGGSVVSPVIVQPMVGILAIGRTQGVPMFHMNSEGKEILLKKEQAVLSWSADHRVVDGATVATCAERMVAFLENFQALAVSSK